MTELLPIADGVFHQLDPRVIPHERITGLIATALIGAVSFMAVSGGSVALWLGGGQRWWVAVLPAIAWVAAFGGIARLFYQWPVISYRHTSYKVDAQGIEIRRGVFWRRAINVPRSRVQHTDVSQGPLERHHGLGTLVV